MVRNEVTGSLYMMEGGVHDDTLPSGDQGR